MNDRYKYTDGAEYLSQLLEMRGIKKSTLARGINVSKNTIARATQPNPKHPISHKILQRIANYLKHPEEVLMIRYGYVPKESARKSSEIIPIVQSIEEFMLTMSKSKANQVLDFAKYLASTQDE